VCVVERRRRRRKRKLVCTCGRATTVVEKTDSSSVDGSSGDRRSRQRQRLIEFCDKKEMARDRLLFIGSKLSAAVLNYNPF
jgi:hypothetical protein